jgi:hypothetical protein
MTAEQIAGEIRQAQATGNDTTGRFQPDPASDDRPGHTR